MPVPVATVLTPMLSAGGKWQLRLATEAAGPHEPATAAAPASAPATVPVPAGQAHAPVPRPAAHVSGRPHLIRSERTPVTPAGSRRPAHTERPAAGRAAARPATGG